MGATGAGKSTVGAALSSSLGWPFLDADDLHSPAHIEKMRAGVALSDDDREPWLRRIHERLSEVARDEQNVVLACSALKPAYRRTIAEGIPDVHWVLLDADPALLQARLLTRRGHFAGPALVPTQLAALEPPDDAIVIAAAQPVDSIVQEIRKALDVRRGP